MNSTFLSFKIHNCLKFLSTKIHNLFYSLGLDFSFFSFFRHLFFFFLWINLFVLDFSLLSFHQICSIDSTFFLFYFIRHWFLSYYLCISPLLHTGNHLLSIFLSIVLPLSSKSSVEFFFLIIANFCHCLQRCFSYFLPWTFFLLNF